MYSLFNRAERRRQRALELAIEVRKTHCLATAEIMTLAFTFDGWMSNKLLPDFIVDGNPMPSAARLVPAPQPHKAA